MGLQLAKIEAQLSAMLQQCVHFLSRFCMASKIRLVKITGSSSPSSFHRCWRRGFQPAMVCRRRPCWHGNQLLGEKNLSDDVKQLWPFVWTHCSYLQVKSTGGLLGNSSMSVCGNYLLLEPKTCDGLWSGAILLPPALWKRVHGKSTFLLSRIGFWLAPNGNESWSSGILIGREGSFRQDSPAAYWTKRRHSVVQP